MIYSAKEIIERAKQVEGYTHIPKDYWLAPIRVEQSKQKPNEFNDIANLMHNDKLVMTTTCTTTPGLPALKGGFKKYNSKGAAVVCADLWMYDSFAYGLHSGRMPALREVKNIWVTRDGDLDSLAEEQGQRYYGMWNTNFHAATYNFADTLLRKIIGAWSYGCMVCNYRPEYNKIIELCKPQKSVSIVVLNEFPV